MMPANTIKAIGADFELANSFIGDRASSPRRAAQSLLQCIVGYPLGSSGGTAIEYGRRFLDTCGSSWYIDSDHLEGNLPEHTSALEHPKWLHGAGFAPAREAMREVQARLPFGTQLNVLANCSDGNTAWGSHFNVSVTRACWDNMMRRRPHLASFLATHLVTSVIYNGQGLVGPANKRSPCDYQLSQRADWFETFADLQTMYDRPLINTRDEPHAGSDLARLHIIYHDMVLSPVANILKAGTTQLVCAMIESGWVDPSLCLEDTVSSASEVSRDLSLRRTLPTTVRGRKMTAVEMQQALAELAGEFVAEGLAEGIVPDAEEIVSLWLETLDMLAQRDIDALAGRCDCWLKYLLLDRQRGRRRLPWSSDAMKVADSLFASLDPEISLFYQAADSGVVERMPTEDELQRYTFEPPDETRAYFRAHLLRRYGEAVSSMDWSQITFRVAGARHWWATANIPMKDPTGFNKLESDIIFEQCETLEEIVEAANALADGAMAADETAHAGQNGKVC